MDKQKSATTDTQKVPASNAPHPIVLLLPSAGNYEKGNVDALIFLAVESNQSLTTGEAIASEIKKLTNGLCSFKQPYISRRLSVINTHHIVARNKIWSISKFEGKYKLVDIDEESKMNRKSAFSAIPFDRSTVFQNNTVGATVFGFKVKASPEELDGTFKKAENFFDDFLDHCIFQMIRQADVLYILLDSHQHYYPAVKKRLETFIETEYLLRASR